MDCFLIFWIVHTFTNVQMDIVCIWNVKPEACLMRRRRRVTIKRLLRVILVFPVQMLLDYFRIQETATSFWTVFKACPTYNLVLTDWCLTKFSSDVYYPSMLSVVNKVYIIIVLRFILHWFYLSIQIVLTGWLFVIYGIDQDIISLVPGSSRATVRNGTSVIADDLEDTIKNDLNDAYFCSF